MSFNINSFKTNIADFGYLKTNRFELIIAPPPILQNSSNSNRGTPTAISEIVQNIRFRADQARIPSIALNTTDINRYGAGPSQKMPVSAQFAEIPISIISDGYGDIWQFWHNWTKGVYDFTGASYASSGQSSRTATYTADYRDNYSTTIEIIVYDEFNNAIQKVDLYEAYPIMVRDIPLNWADQNILRININLTFKEYTIQGTNIVPVAQSPQSSTLSRINSAINDASLVTNFIKNTIG